MPIQKFFHLIHIVDDFDAAQARYIDLLAPDVYRPKHWSEFDKRFASLAVIGPDFVLELMEPSGEAADQGAPLPKFRARHGEHLHSLAWYVDPDDFVLLKKRMQSHDIRVLEPYGAVDAEDAEANGWNTFFTFPKDTFGQLELQRAPGPVPSPADHPTWRRTGRARTGATSTRSASSACRTSRRWWPTSTPPGPSTPRSWSARSSTRRPPPTATACS